MISRRRWDPLVAYYPRTVYLSLLLRFSSSHWHSSVWILLICNAVHWKSCFQSIRSRQRVRDDDKINYHGVEDIDKLSTRIRANYQQRGEYYEREPQEDCQKIDHRRNCWEKSKRLPSLEKKREEEEKCSTNRTAESGDECLFLELSSFAGEQSERDTYIPK